ncbi:MAG: cyclic nucleotide-binding domain-containing protein, partial [Cyanobacteriota bacterium]
MTTCKQLSERLSLHLYDQNPLARSTIRRSYTGNHIQSRRCRSNTELVHLRNQGQSLRILHAQGVLDFSGTEQLLANLEGMAQGAKVIVLDMRHVQELPPNSLEMLIQTMCELDRRGIRVVISRAHGLIESPRWPDLTQQSGIELVEDLDIALELGESLVLQDRQNQPDRPAPGLPSLLLQLDPPQRRELEGLLLPRTVEAGERVIRRGDDGDSLFLIVSGHFTTAISVQIGSGDCRQSRLAAFTGGMCFGEISFLSGKPRSADVIADEPGHLLVLRRDDFERLRVQSPETAIQLLLALSAELGGRLGRTSYQLSVMDHL